MGRTAFSKKAQIEIHFLRHETSDKDCLKNAKNCEEIIEMDCTLPWKISNQNLTAAKYA